MHSMMSKVGASLALLVLFASGCEDPNCGTDLVYDPANHLCVCRAPAVLDPETDLCVVSDSGLVADGGVDPADACRPSVERCNGIDDDCDGVIDGPAAALSCGDAANALEMVCTAGECLVARCAPDRADCDGDFANGCEVDLRSDLAHCGTCGTGCAWECAESECDDPIQIAVAERHACAVRARGTVVCWGGNDSAQLGDGTMVSRTRPSSVLGLSDVTQVTTGARHTCALTRPAGDVYCWGSNDRGQLGDGSHTTRSEPVRVLSNAAEVDAGGGVSTCARRRDGTVWCWGYIGGFDGSGIREQLRPVEIPGITDVVQIATGANGAGVTCARRAAGGITCWTGLEDNGPLLGAGMTTSPRTPVNVPGIDDAASVAVGIGHVCAGREDGSLFCWGHNVGQLGLGAGSDEVVGSPRAVAGVRDVLEVAAGFASTCVRTLSGAVECVGRNEYGQLGDGTGVDRAEYRSQWTIESGARAIAGSSISHGHCALLEPARAVCWGANFSGGVGDGSIENRLTPVAVLAP